MSKTETNEMAIPEAAPASSITALAMTPSAATSCIAMLRENIGGDLRGEHEFTSISVPSGGGTQWAIPSISGDIMASTIRAVVVSQHKARNYYASTFDENPGMPPSCSSRDGETGVGDPGGDCASCPLAQWVDKDKPSCQERLDVLLLTEHEDLPIYLSVPPSSLRPWRDFMKGLASQKRARFCEVILTLGLKRATNKRGIVYSEIELGFEAALGEAEKAVVRAYRHSLGVATEADGATA